MDIPSDTAALNPPRLCDRAHGPVLPPACAHTVVRVRACARARLCVWLCLRARLAMFSLHAMHTHVPPRHSAQRYLQPIYIYNALRAAVPVTKTRPKPILLLALQPLPRRRKARSRSYICLRW